MATFLQNLPSFNKDNFSNFQPENNKYLPKKQSIYACNHTDDPFEQLIVNQRCNLVIQYLEKQAKETQLAENLSSHASKAARKRDINKVNKLSSKISSDEEAEDDDEDAEKSMKKKRTHIDETMPYQQTTLLEARRSANYDSNDAAAGSSNQGNEAQESDNIIEVDDDVQPTTNNSSASNNNDDEIDV